VGIVLGLAVLAVSTAEAGWVWRGGQWQYIDEKEPPPPPPPERPKTQPIKPSPETKPPAEETKPPVEETKPPAEETKPPDTPAKPPAEETKPPEAETKPPVPVARPPKTVTRPPEAETPAPAAFEKPATPRPPAKSAAEAEKPSGDEGTPSFEPQATTTRWWWKRGEDPNGDRHLFDAGRNAASRKDYFGAAATFKSLIKQYKESPLRAEAMWLRAEALYADKDYYHAFEQYEELLTSYAGSPHYHDALARNMEVAELFFSGVKRKLLGMIWVPAQTEAVEILRKVYEHQPTGDLAPKAVIRIGNYYWDKHEWQSAEDYFDKYCREYPNGEAVKAAELRRAKCALERCRGAVYDTTSLKLCRDRLDQFRQKYPDVAEEEGVPRMMDDLHAMQGEALYRTGNWYHRTGQSVAAAHYFEEVQAQYADTPWGGLAEAELNRMKGIGGTKAP
jgi:outer membrane protein assembly factor BamD (BamD/ComL family)